MSEVFILFTEKKIHYDGYDTTHSDGDVLIEKETSPSLGRFAVTLPVTFFDYSRNVSLLHECKPFVIKVVDINRHQWYYKKQIKLLAKNTVIDKEANSNTKVQRKDSPLNVGVEKVEMNMHGEVLKPKIRPVDMSTFVDYNKLIKRNSSKELIKHVKEDEKNCMPRPLGFKRLKNIDFKKNVGLVGLKLSHIVHLNVSNAIIANTRPKDKKEVQSTAVKCGNSAKYHSTSNSNKQKSYSKIEDKTKELLKTEQDSIKLNSSNKDSSEGNVNVKELSITSINSKLNKGCDKKVETANDLVNKMFFVNEYVNPNEEKHDSIKKVVENPILTEMLNNSTISLKSNNFVGQHIKFDPGVSTTIRELGRKAKLNGFQKVSKKVTEYKNLKYNNNKIISTKRTVDGKTKVPSECNKDKKKINNKKKDEISDTSKHSSGIKEALNKDNALKMVVSKTPSTVLNANQNFDPGRIAKKHTTGDNNKSITIKTQDLTHSTCNGKQPNICASVITGKCLPDNVLQNDNNNVLNYYQMSSKTYPTITNPSMSHFSEHNFRRPAVGNRQLCSFYIEKSGQAKNISVPITKTDAPESHVVSGAASQILMHINSNNDKSAVLVENSATKENSVIQGTSLPLVTARHSNLPKIVQTKALSHNANENIVQNANHTLAAGKPTETKKSRTILAFTDVTINEQVILKHSPLRVYGKFDAKDDIIGRMNNPEIYVSNTTSKSSVNIEDDSKITVNQGQQLVQEKPSKPNVFVQNHQPSSSPIQEIIQRRKSDTTYCVNVGNNSSTLNKVNSIGRFGGSSGIPVKAAFTGNFKGSGVASQGSHGDYIANGNQKGVSSFAQDKNNIHQRFPMTYTNNMGNFGSNMNMIHFFTGGNVGLDVNGPHNNKAVPIYQPVPQQHAGYQPIQSFVSNRWTQGQNRISHMENNLMNTISVDQGSLDPHVMQNEVPMNNVHCAPIYNNILQDMNLPVQYYNPNQSNSFRPYLYPPPPPPPPVQTTGTFYPPTSVNSQSQSTLVPFSVTNSSSIIGRNNSGIIRKINIIAVPLTDKENLSKISSGFTNTVENLDNKPANSKLEMLEELSKVITDIPPDSPVKEEKIPSYQPIKSNDPKADFSNLSDLSPNLNTQSGSIPATDKLTEGVLGSTEVVSAPDRNVPTLTMSDNNMHTKKQANTNVSSPKLSKRDSPMKNPSKCTIAYPRKNVTERSPTEASTEKHSNTLASSSSRKIQNFKKPRPLTEATYPDMRKMLSTNPQVRPGPLSKKPKLHLFQKPNRDQREKLVSPAADIGYSPPILPILTYEKTLEHIAQAHAGTRNIAEKDEFTPNARNRRSQKNCKKRKLFEEDKQMTQDKSVKKISLDEYKKRVGKKSEKDYCTNDMTIKLECKTEKFVHTKHGSDLDLGYDSDSTMIL